MSSLARRSLRATAAVAGIAAAGAGLTGHAFAAPATPEAPKADDAVPSAPDARSAPDVVGGLRPAAPEAGDLPQLFTVEGIGVYTADHGLPEAPTADQLPTEERPSLGDAVNVDSVDRDNGSDFDVQTAEEQDRDGALQQLDSATLFGELPAHALGGTQGHDVRT